MTLAHDALSDLEALAYEAAVEPSLWTQVVADASRAFKAPYTMLNVSDRRGAKVMHAAPPDVNDTAEVTMARYPTVGTNPGLAFVALTPPTAVRLGNRIVSDSDLERLDFYQGILRPLGLWHAAIMNVHRDDAVLAGMAFMRARKERPFGDGDLAALRALAPHFNRALRVTLRLRELEARASALAEMTDRALVALVLTDAFGRIAEANGVARAILAENDGLILRDGVLRAARGEDCIRLSRLIQEAAGSRIMPMSGVMHVSRPSGRRQLPLAVSPTRNGASALGRSHAVSIAFADPERAPEPCADLIARLYGFTAREAGVAALLLRGLSPSEAAGKLAMTENTVRTHIRHLFDKTGVERLADLVRLLMQGPGVRGR
jgi:DNA-binding CsgD family transcriptional regulator